VGVVPLRRMHDETAPAGTTVPDRERNQCAFQEILNVLENSGAVLIFPEGKSHNGHTLEPLKTGLARLALQARTERKIVGVNILPIGLLFEDKGTPGSVLGANIGEPIAIDCWPDENPRTLTDEIATRLRKISNETAMPEESITNEKRSFAREFLVGLAAWWGLTTHRLPVRIARNIAVCRGRDADQPAMLTILFGIALVILTYAVHVAIVGILLHSLLAAVLYLASLLCGAYWAAFRQHEKHF
jgi:hypothetical protein